MDLTGLRSNLRNVTVEWEDGPVAMVDALIDIRAGAVLNVALVGRDGERVEMTGELWEQLNARFRAELGR